jgi:hypothetical protein
MHWLLANEDTHRPMFLGIAIPQDRGVRALIREYALHPSALTALPAPSMCFRGRALWSMLY